MYRTVRFEIYLKVKGKTLSQLPDGICFTYLPGPSDKQGFSYCVLFPLQQFLINEALHFVKYLKYQGKDK
jgi:hypothetical protein